MAKRTLENIYSRVAAATVAVGPPSRRGQGVYVGNGHIITAAHCLSYDQDTGIRLAMEDHVFYKIETAAGEKMPVAPLVIESAVDIAVLGALDGQVFPPEMVEPFEAFCDRTKPVPLCRKRFPYSGARFDPKDRASVERFIAKTEPTKFRVHIRTHRNTWVTGEATVFQLRSCNPTIWVQADENIEGGTSGGPIINDAGELVGVVSTAGGSGGETRTGRSPFPRWALPAWIYHRICGKAA